MTTIYWKWDFNERTTVDGWSESAEASESSEKISLYIDIVNYPKKLPVVRITVQDVYPNSVVLVEMRQKVEKQHEAETIFVYAVEAWCDFTSHKRHKSLIRFSPNKKKENFYCSNIEHWKLYFHLFYIRWGKLFSSFFFLLATKAAGGALWYFLMTTSTLVLFFFEGKHSHTYTPRERNENQENGEKVFAFWKAWSGLIKHLNEVLWPNECEWVSLWTNIKFAAFLWLEKYFLRTEKGILLASNIRAAEAALWLG